MSRTSLNPTATPQALERSSSAGPTLQDSPRLPDWDPPVPAGSCAPPARSPDLPCKCIARAPPALACLKRHSLHGGRNIIGIQSAPLYVHSVQRDAV
eukprot:scaffold7543_cov122-Isochrysis_galbana.AAC.4